MDLCLIKLNLMISNEICTAEEVLQGFLLSKDDIHFKFDKELKSLKKELNNWKWEVLNDFSANPKVICQLLIDFMEGLNSPIIESKDYELIVSLGD